MDAGQVQKPGRPPRSAGDLTAAKRALLEALAEVHLDAHGGDVEKSLAAVSAGKSTQESLARIGGPEVEATLARVGSGSTSPDADHDRTMTLSVGTAHQRRPAVPGPCGPTPGAAWAPSSSRSTPS